MTGAEKLKPQPPETDPGSLVAPAVGSSQQLPAGQGSDPTTLDQENAKEQELGGTVDKGEADRRVRE